MQNVDEALKVLEEQINEVKKVPYDKLTELMGVARTKTYAIEGDEYENDGYDVEIESVWEGKEGGNLVINIVVFEKDPSSYIPVTASFIITPEGSIVEGVEDALP